MHGPDRAYSAVDVAGTCLLPAAPTEAFAAVAFGASVIESAPLECRIPRNQGPRRRPAGFSL